jgi:hydrogenase maturation protease
VYAAREVRRRLDAMGRAETADVVETEVGGFALMELMIDWDRVILVDAIQFDDVSPGTLVQIDPQDLRTSLRIRSVHDVDLPTVLRLGRCLGLKMPAEILVYGIQAEDACTLGENLTSPVKQGMRAAVDLMLDHLTTDAPRQFVNPQP